MKKGDGKKNQRIPKKPDRNNGSRGLLLVAVQGAKPLAAGGDLGMPLNRRRNQKGAWYSFP